MDLNKFLLFSFYAFASWTVPSFSPSVIPEVCIGMLYFHWAVRISFPPSLSCASCLFKNQLGKLVGFPAWWESHNCPSFSPEDKRDSFAEYLSYSKPLCRAFATIGLAGLCVIQICCCSASDRLCKWLCICSEQRAREFVYIAPWSLPGHSRGLGYPGMYMDGCRGELHAGCWTDMNTLVQGGGFDGNSLPVRSQEQSASAKCLSQSAGGECKELCWGWDWALQSLPFPLSSCCGSGKVVLVPLPAGK